MYLTLSQEKKAPKRKNNKHSNREQIFSKITDQDEKRHPISQSEWE